MNKRKLLFYGLVIMLFISITLFSSTFAKYISNVEIKNSVEIGELYVGYENGKVFRNSYEIENNPFNEDGHTVIEVFDIKPSDEITYEFTISNISYSIDEFNNLTIKEYNSVSANYRINLTVELLLPMLVENNRRTISFDFAKIDKETGQPIGAYLDTPIKLAQYNPNKDGTLNTNSIYQQKYRIVIDEEDTAQLTDLTSKDYYGASLCIYITVTSEQDIPIITG